MISAVVHTYNEERNIRNCLSSLKFVDEIVLVDMGSSDRTLEFVHPFNPRIFSHPYTRFVEPARNFGIGKAHGSWIIIVDADEVIPASLAKEIKAICRDKKRIFNYYRIPRKNIIFKKWIKNTGWWPDYQIRLFKNGSVSWNESIHGIPQTHGRGFDLPVKEDLAIEHNNYHSIFQFIERLNRYTDIQAKEQFAKDKNTDFADIVLKPSSEFVNRFFLREGYKDGFHGLALSALQAFSETIVVLKKWELKGFPNTDLDLEKYSQVSIKAKNINDYWLTTERLKSPRSFISTLLLKLKRTLIS